MNAKFNFSSKSKLQKSTSTTCPEGKVIQGQKALLSKKTARGISRTVSREQARPRHAPTPLRGASLQTHTDRTEPLSVSCPKTTALWPSCWVPRHTAGTARPVLPELTQKAFGQPQPWCSSSSRFLDAHRLTSPLPRIQRAASSTAPHCRTTTQPLTPCCPAQGSAGSHCAFWG